MRPEEMNETELWDYVQSLERELAADRETHKSLQTQLTRSEARCTELEMAVRSLGFCNQCNGTGTAVYGPCQICGSVGLDHRAQAALSSAQSAQPPPNSSRK